MSSSACIHRGAELRPVSLCHTTVRGTTTRRFYPAFRCVIFGRCLTGLAAWQPQHAGAEAKLYALCRGCEHAGR